MNLQTETLGENRVEYYIHGKNPQLLITTGTHGDEGTVVDLVKNAVAEYLSLLPDFIYIPVVSPSAALLGTRKNADGVDLNRRFTSHSCIDEAKTCLVLVKQYRFKTHIDFHEDRFLKEFYLYEINPEDRGPSPTVSDLLLFLRNHGVALWDGIDDTTDPKLGNIVVSGYTQSKWQKNDGSLDGWLRQQKLVRQVFIPEIPGKADRGTKKMIVEAIFEHLL